ncbi:GGDEF domain-containing protein [Jiella sp. MQZ9-1]|uniref:GGDEF domain-containing protein n=1 Tax=Jiella flava TaxID=2816857 RepID=A0A939JV69_9HYPH|nr:GGDEF domain-containing protein [Jiella flava]MBO0663890.1 GGDEF domain-containing protein [Jiella flava]MCD2472462.1 GGDEF domain-containing protein [Jiella flava]
MTAMAGDDLSFAIMSALLAAFSMGVINYAAVRPLIGLPQAMAPGLCAIPFILMSGRPELIAVAALMFVLPLSVITMSHQQSRILMEVFNGRYRERVAARTDVLTGLLNARAFEEAVGEIPRDAPVAAIFIDLDGFKPVNDKYGHAVGDAVLRAVAARLVSVCDPADIVARVGGDEFTVLSSGNCVAAAKAAADRMLREISAPYWVDDCRVEIGASIGVAVRNTPDCTVTNLIRSADMAMYEAKRRGRGQVFVFVDPLAKTLLKPVQSAA